MSSLLKNWFCSEEIDKFNKIIIKKSIRSFNFDLPPSFTQKFIHPDIVFCSAHFLYLHNDNEDILQMQLKLHFEAPSTEAAKKINILPAFTIIFLLDNSDTIKLEKGIDQDKEIDELPNGTMLVTEKIDYNIPIDSFISLANSTKIEWQISGTYEGEISSFGLMSIKGFYNAVFDEDFEKDILINWINENKEDENENSFDDYNVDKNDIINISSENINSNPEKGDMFNWIDIIKFLSSVLVLIMLIMKCK